MPKGYIVITEDVKDPAGMAEMLAGVFEASPQDVLDSPLTLIGSESEVIERLHARRERWSYSYTVIPGDQLQAFAPVVAQLTGT